MAYEVKYGMENSRFWPGVADAYTSTEVDYMSVQVKDRTGQEVELYAEIDPALLTDENGEPAYFRIDFGFSFWNPRCENGSIRSFEPLKAAILKQAKSAGVDTNRLIFPPNSKKLQ